MMFAKTVVMAALAIAHVQAQGTTANSTIDANTVPASTRSSWCNGQINTCGTLCGGDTESNECNPDSLVFDCTCSSNSSAPGLQYYTQTVPTFICEQLYGECIQRGANNAAAQRLCTQNRDNNCGTLDPDDFEESADSTDSASSSATASSTSSATSDSESASASPTDNAGISYQASSTQIGLGMLLAAVFGYLV